MLPVRFWLVTVSCDWVAALAVVRGNAAKEAKDSSIIMTSPMTKVDPPR